MSITYLEDIVQFQLQLGYYEEKLMRVRFYIFISATVGFLLGVILTVLIKSIEHKLF